MLREQDVRDPQTLVESVDEEKNITTEEGVWRNPFMY